MEGRIDLLHGNDPIDVERMLGGYGAQGPYVSLAFEIDGEPGGRVCYMVGSIGDENPRARRALVWLCGVHLIVTGPTAFVDIDPALVSDLVRDLG